MSAYSSIEIVEGIKNRDNDVAKHIYDNSFTVLRHYLMGKGMNTEDIKDLFQEALEIVLFRFDDAKFVLNSSFETFLFSVCRNLFLQNIKYKKVHDNNKSDMQYVFYLCNDFEKTDENEIKERRNHLFHKYMKVLEKDCKKLLILCWNNMPVAEIAKILKTSASVISQRKYTCCGRLVNLIEKDPEYMECYK